MYETQNQQRIDLKRIIDARFATHKGVIEKQIGNALAGVYTMLDTLLADDLEMFEDLEEITY